MGAASFISDLFQSNKLVKSEVRFAVERGLPRLSADKGANFGANHALEHTGLSK